MAVTLIEALDMLVAAIEGNPYVYDTINEKRWVLDDGGVSGNCNWCEDNADMGWIGDDETFESYEGDIDGPPAHQNCFCELSARP